MINLCHILILSLKIKLIKVLVKKLNKIKTAFVTFFPIKPDAMGSSTAVNSRFNNWPFKKKIFQISHLKKINNKL